MWRNVTSLLERWIGYLLILFFNFIFLFRLFATLPFFFLLLSRPTSLFSIFQLLSMSFFSSFFFFLFHVVWWDVVYYPASLVTNVSWFNSVPSLQIFTKKLIIIWPVGVGHDYNGYSKISIKINQNSLPLLLLYAFLLLILSICMFVQPIKEFFIFFFVSFLAHFLFLLYLPLVYSCISNFFCRFLQSYFEIYQFSFFYYCNCI